MKLASKLLKPAFLAGLLITSFSGMAIAAESEGDAKSNLPPGALSGLAEFKDVIFPDYYGRNFVLGEGSIGVSLNLGCSGFGEFSMFANLGSDIERSFNYIKGNAAGLAINYLIYSRPTAYQLYTNINTHLDFMKELGSLSCGSIRSMAESHRKGLISAAKDECGGDGKATIDCDDPSTLRDYVAAGIEKVKAAAKQHIGDGYNNTKKVVVKLFEKQVVDAPENQNAPPKQKEELNKTLELVKAALGEHIIENDGAVDVSLPTAAAGLVIREEAERFVLAIQAVLRTNPLGDEREAALKKLNEIPTIKSVSPRTIVALEKLRDNQPWEYQARLGILANSMAVQTLNVRLARVDAFIKRQYALNADEKLFTPGEYEQLQNNLAAFKAEINAINVLNSAKDAQSEIEQKIINGFGGS